MKGSSDSTISGVPYLSLMASWKSRTPGTGVVCGRGQRSGAQFPCGPIEHQPDLLHADRARPAIRSGAPSAASATFARASTWFASRSAWPATGADRWSWGVDLAPSVGRNLFTPAAFAAPGLGANLHPVYAVVQQQDIEFGLGAQAGLRCQVDKDLSFGVSIFTPTWFHSYSWTIHDPSGAARTVTFRMDRPLTAQVGMNFRAGGTLRISLRIWAISPTARLPASNIAGSAPTVRSPAWAGRIPGLSNWASSMP